MEIVTKAEAIARGISGAACYKCENFEPCGIGSDTGTCGYMVDTIFATVGEVDCLDVKFDGRTCPAWCKHYEEEASDDDV